MRIAFAALMITLMTVPLRAQWDFRTPGIPRLADGSPNLAAPAPRTAKGKPDFSGVWKLEPTAQQTGIQDYLAGPEFGNIAARLNRPLPYQPWAEALVKERAAGLGKDDPVASCWPGGTIRLYTYPPYRKIVQNAGLLVLLSERDVTFPDLHRRSSAAQGSESFLQRIFDWPMGKRHSGRSDHRISRRNLA